MREVSEVTALANYILSLRFDDGVQGIVDFADLVPFAGVFAPLIDPDYFAQVRIDPAWGTVCWPNGADLDSLVLYAHVKGSSISVSDGRLIV